MENKKLSDELVSKAISKDNKLYLSCSMAFSLSEKYQISRADVGKLCDELKIKITNCQLGCF